MPRRVSELVASCVSSVADGFEQIPARPGIWHRRYRAPLFSFIVVQHSTRYKCFEVDVASSVFATWDRQFGTHQLRRSTGLANLRVGSKMILMENVPYRYAADPGSALNVIAEELRSFAIPWFEAHRREIGEDPLVQRGLAEIAERCPDRVTLEAMKRALRNEAATVGASMWHRKETAILAADLLRRVEE
jgi:hypothetical protein